MRKPIELDDNQDFSADEYTMPADSSQGATPEQHASAKVERKTHSLLPNVKLMPTERDITAAEVYIGVNSNNKSNRGGSKSRAQRLANVYEDIP